MDAAANRCWAWEKGRGGGCPTRKGKGTFAIAKLNNNDPLQPLFPLDLSPDLSLWGSVYISRDFFYTFCIYS